MPAMTNERPERVWLITGSTRGFGRALVDAVLDRGDRVLATARSVAALDELVERWGADRVRVAPLDVTDADAATRAVALAVDAFGRLDVVANNAGYADSAPIEELPADDFRAQVETNLFGVVNVSRAALPVFRRQRSGLFLQFSSVGGRVGGTPGMGAYQAAKFAVEGFSEVLAREAAPFGVRVVIVEPGAFRTDWQGSSMRMHPVGADYEETVGALHEFRRSSQGSQPGDPVRAARLLAGLPDLADLPLRLPLGAAAVDLVVASDRRPHRGDARLGRPQPVGRFPRCGCLAPRRCRACHGHRPDGQRVGGAMTMPFRQSGAAASAAPDASTPPPSPPGRAGGAVPTRAGDRTTLFEIFFDLVFVFALTRVVALVEVDPDAGSLLHAGILLVLLWWAWCAFIWLGNQVRLDRGFVRAGMLVAMAALFVVASAIPEAWTRHPAGASPALVLAIAFTVVRGCYAGLFAAVAWGHPRLRRQVLLDLAPQLVSAALLICGALLGGAWQAGLWAAAFLLDFVGGRTASRYRGWRIGSPRHFSERHDLVLIIALGETVLATGARVDPWSSGPLALVVALVGFVITASLWWAFFGGLSARAAQAFADADPVARPALARDAYTFGQFPLVAGVALVAVGGTLLLDDVTASPTAPATGLAVTALAAGLVLFLLGLELFRWTLLRSWRLASAIGAAAVLVVGAASPWCPAWVVAVLAAVTVAVTASVVGRLGRHH